MRDLGALGHDLHRLQLHRGLNSPHGVPGRESGQLGNRKEHGRIFQRLEAMAVIGHDQQVTASGIPRLASCCESYPPMQDQSRGLARILVLGEASAGDHADHCLPQHFFMTAEDSVCGMSTTRSCG
jgi:hypothetical protein